MDQTMLDKFSEITTNEAYADVAKTIKTPEEMQQFLSDKGLEMSIEDIVTIAKAFVDQTRENDDELSEEQLTSVAGGGRFGKCLVALLGLGLSVSTGNVWAAAYFVIGGYAAARGY